MKKHGWEIFEIVHIFLRVASTYLCVGRAHFAGRTYHGHCP